MKKTLLSILSIASLLLFQSCSMPEVKPAKFQKDTKEVINDLKSLKDFEDATIKWSATSFDNKTTNVLIVQLLNGKGLSDNPAELRDLGKEALQVLNRSIENEKDYDRFQVVFIQKASTGLLTTSFTTPFEYSLDELE